MKAGIVGLPNAGKSTLFNALMEESRAHVANYPFCTIEPNIGQVPVKDKRLDAIADIVRPNKRIYTTLEFVDIAGLIEGASQGAGLGNAFLDNIRDVDIIVHVVRAFPDPDTFKEPTIAYDIDIINTELFLADLQRIERYITKHQANKKANQQELAWAQEAMKKLQAEEALNQNNQEIDKEKYKFFKGLGLLTIKPRIFIANVDDLEVKPNNIGQDFLVLSAKHEYDLTQMLDQMFVSRLPSMIMKAYDTLGLITFFTAGLQEARAWTISKNTLAPDAAGTIHTDFAKKFIRAEVVSYEDFITYNGWEGARAKGKLRVEGKKYIVRDGDVCLFKV